jgi:Holliday junction resolvase RusA-like endonuclease
MQIDFFVKGRPQGKARPRVTRYGTYTPQTTKDYEQKVRVAFWQSNNSTKRTTPTPAFAADVCVSAEIVAYYEIPKSWSKKKRAAAIEGRLRPTVKPDTDNIAKIILDSLNGLAYHDDKQVVRCSVSKWYGDVAGVSVKVKEA